VLKTTADRQQSFNYQLQNSPTMNSTNQVSPSPPSTPPRGKAHGLNLLQPSSPSLELSLSPSKIPATVDKTPPASSTCTSDDESSADTDHEDDDPHKYLTFQDIQTLLGSTPLCNKKDPAWKKTRIEAGKALIDRCIESNQRYLTKEHTDHKRTGKPPCARATLKKNIVDFTNQTKNHWVFKKKTQRVAK